ncbi:MAG: phenylalanine--tRNA ligase subunit beta [Acidobacteria bacterium]|nr:phenylalanine--tRNA ligase subunit beta [Acidobacteriota bacterium]
MKISYNWLGELVRLTLSPQALAEKLTMSGLAVEAVEACGDDFVLEFDLTSNRPDALCHLGVAREVALLCNTALTPRNVALHESAEAIEAITSIEIQSPDLCPRYAARIIKGVKVGASPAWLVKRLEAIGQRSVNNIADITNYVMFEMGQPTHAFDLNLLHEQRIIVRRAYAGEKMVTLDGVERQLSPDMCIIADADRAVAIGGVMGGEATEINDHTTDVFLESAYFNPASVRSTARALGMNSEASYRYERGADYDSQVRVADRVAGLIVELAGGTILKGALDIYPKRLERDAVKLRESRIERLTGVRVELEKAAEILTGLEFVVAPFAERRELLAVAPSFRIDISREEDLVEEVIRHVGYDNIGTTLPDWNGEGQYLYGENRRRKVRGIFTDLGFHEAVSFSFVSGERDRMFRVDSDYTARLANPIDVNEDEMRASLLTGLLEALQRNFHQGRRDVKLFELGRVFTAESASQRPDEREMLGLVMSGNLFSEAWRGNRQIDFYDLKGVVEAVVGGLNISGFTIERARVEYLHPGQSAVLNRDGEVIARFGRLHPRIASLYKFRQNVFVGEMEFGSLLALAATQVTYKPLPRFPGVSRDISALLDAAHSWGEIEQAINELGIREIVAVTLFDLFKGKEMAAGMRSLAFRVAYRSDERTLTDEEVSQLHERVTAVLAQRFAAQLR